MSFTSNYSRHLTSFHVCIICGISNIACLRFSNLLKISVSNHCPKNLYSDIDVIIFQTYRPFSVLSDSFPFTRCPIPVPFTLKPFSIRLLSLSPVPLTEYGNNSSTPCCRASFTNSACLRNEKTGSCHLPVIGCFCALKGFGIDDSICPVGMSFAVEADDEVVPASEGEEDVEEDWGMMAGGG